MKPAILMLAAVLWVFALPAAHAQASQDSAASPANVCGDGNCEPLQDVPDNTATDPSLSLQGAYTGSMDTPALSDAGHNPRQCAVLARILAQQATNEELQEILHNRGCY